MKYSRKWEQIDAETHRLKTPRGWIVVWDFRDDLGSRTSCMCFVPDENSQWDLEDLPK